MSAFHVRPAKREDALGMAVVRVDTWRATYKGMVADSYLQALSAEGLRSIGATLSGGKPIEVLGSS